MPGAKFEDLLSLVGDRGKWQYVTLLFTWIEGVIIGCHHLSSVFLGYTPKHWCSTDDIKFPSSWTPEQVKEYSIPLTSAGEFETCTMYDISDIRSDYSFQSALSQRTKETRACSGFSFNMDMGQTIVVEWDLVCDRIALLSTVQGSYMGGVFVGCIFWGWASDRFGRRPSILVSSVIQILSCFATMFSYNYLMFVFFRFLVAFSVSGVFECGFVLITEIVSKELRTPVGIMTQFPFGVGASLLPLVAYFIKDWEHLQLAISLPSLALISYYWFIPESPRWLISVGRYSEAMEILKHAAKVNGKTIPSDEEFLDMMQTIEIEHQEEPQQKQNSNKDRIMSAFKEIIALVKTPEMRKRTINIYFSWLVVAMVYYGLSFNTKNIGGDIYVSNFISGMAEVVACVLIIPALSRFGRVKCYSGTFLLGGLSCASVAVVIWSTEPGTLVWLIITLAMTGKFLIAGTFALAYLYTAELFPTPVRNIAVGGASTFARIGSMSAPYIVDILGKVNAGIPVVIFGIASAIAGIFAMWLPETLNRKLPESVADVEEYGRRKNQGKGNVELGDSGAEEEEQEVAEVQKMEPANLKE